MDLFIGKTSWYPAKGVHEIASFVQNVQSHPSFLQVESLKDTNGHKIL